MTATGKLATIDKVDLREVWPNEAADFTPWLAENIAELGGALGMDLAVQAREAPVGTNRLDLLASDGSGRTVVIENQLGITDHNHLGQLLTYMAGFDANVIVWIARNFRDEHAEALSLLNRRTGEDTEFFGIEVELWSIDKSRPAVNFKLVTAPNEWGKQTTSNPPAGTSERSERYRDFFQGLIDTLREEHHFTNARKAQLKAGTPSQQDTHNVLNTAPVSRWVEGPGSSCTSITLRGIGTRVCSTSYSSVGLTSSLKSGKSLNGNAWMIAERRA